MCRYVGEKDLAFFKYHAVEGGPCQGASEWQQMMQKDIPGFVRYQSWRRTLPDGKTEYKSVTISPNATAREFSDLYLDDDFRRNWVSSSLGLFGGAVWMPAVIAAASPGMRLLPLSTSQRYCLTASVNGRQLGDSLLYGCIANTAEPAWRSL